MFIPCKIRYLVVSTKKNWLFVLENSVPRDTVCHHLANLVMPIGDPRDRFPIPTSHS